MMMLPESPRAPAARQPRAPPAPQKGEAAANAEAKKMAEGKKGASKGGLYYRVIVKVLLGGGACTFVPQFRCPGQQGTGQKGA